MLNRRHLLIAALSATMPLCAQAADRLPVVATFSILGDIVATVGGDRVAVTTLVGPDGDAHVFQPAPADAAALTGAAVLVTNGLGFEGWMDRLIAAAEFAGPVVVASTGVTPLEAGGDDHDHAATDVAEDEHAHDHGAIDPHAWQSIANARLYVANIAAALTAADPAGADTYAANAAAYLAEMDAVEAEIFAAVAALAPDRRSVVTSHDAFGYFAAAYGLSFHAPEGMSTEAEASAAGIAALITQIRDESIPAVFVENITDARLLEQITAETGAQIGGTLFSDALSAPDGPAPTYLEMMRHNIRTLTAALSA